jgi:hypothetical protein
MAAEQAPTGVSESVVYDGRSGIRINAITTKSTTFL